MLHDYFRTHCQCSEAFRSCLKNTGSEGGSVGNIYFSSGLFQCFDMAPPITGCRDHYGLVQYTTWVEAHCIYILCNAFIGWNFKFKISQVKLHNFCLPFKSKFSHIYVTHIFGGKHSWKCVMLPSSDMAVTVPQMSQLWRTSYEYVYCTTYTYCEGGNFRGH